MLSTTTPALAVTAPVNVAAPSEAIDKRGVPDVLKASVSKSMASGSYADNAALPEKNIVPDPADCGRIASLSSPEAALTEKSPLTLV